MDPSLIRASKFLSLVLHHGSPVVLRVAAGDGHELVRSENGVWLAREVPVRYLASP